MFSCRQKLKNLHKHTFMLVLGSETPQNRLKTRILCDNFSVAYLGHCSKTVVNPKSELV